jgi:hypothetical protein
MLFLSLFCDDGPCLLFVFRFEWSHLLFVFLCLLSLQALCFAVDSLTLNIVVRVRIGLRVG